MIEYEIYINGVLKEIVIDYYEALFIIKDYMKMNPEAICYIEEKIV